MNLEKRNSIVGIIENFLLALRIEGSVLVTPITERRVVIQITVNDGYQGYLIGKQGETLSALQHLATLLARKDDEGIHYRIDVNGYQDDRDQLFLKRVHSYVHEKAESKEILLWPMTPYERRLVHEYFLNLGTHRTESEDFGTKRVVRVIKK